MLMRIKGYKGHTTKFALLLKILLNFLKVLVHFEILTQVNVSVYLVL